MRRLAIVSTLCHAARPFAVSQPARTALSSLHFFHHYHVWRTPYVEANVARLSEASEKGGKHAALLACGRRGRWRAALDLLDELEAEPCGATAGAYRSVLLACRKHKRHREAENVLQRMGELADTQAYNEVLHLLRLNSDFEAAESLWLAMCERGVPRDDLTYYHLLHICGDLGEWRRAIDLLGEMRSTLGEDATHSGHVLATARACVRDRRWSRAVDLIREFPARLVAGDMWYASRHSRQRKLPPLSP